MICGALSAVTVAVWTPARNVLTGAKRSHACPVQPCEARAVLPLMRFVPPIVLILTGGVERHCEWGDDGGVHYAHGQCLLLPAPTHLLPCHCCCSQCLHAALTGGARVVG